MLEAAVQNAIRIRAGELGIHLFRNNVGACVDERDQLIRYGLANDSAQMNKRIKSGDLIGWLPIMLTGHRMHNMAVNERAGFRSFGLFLSIECKRTDWMGGYPTQPDPVRFTAREIAQQKWIDLVREGGGIAGFCRSVEEFEALINT